MIKIRYDTILVYSALALATLAVFRQVRNFEFVSFDDNLYVYDNDYVKKGISRESIAEMLANEKTEIGYWHPLTSLSHMLDYEIYGLKAGGHHFTSVLFHTANSLLLLFVLNSMTGCFWPSAFVAALFALHPIHVESVAWVSERKDVLSTFFGLLAMMFYVLYTQNRHQTPDTRHQTEIKNLKSEVSGLRSGVWYAACLAAYALSLMSKSMLVTLPFILLLLDYWPLSRFTDKRKIGLLILEKLPFFILSLIVSRITFIAMQECKAIAVIEYLSLKARVLNSVVSYMAYIGGMFYPLQLSFFYPHPGDNLLLWKPTVSLIVLILMSGGVIYTARKRPYMTVGWLWYLGTLVPVIGLTQAGRQVRADHFTYIPLIGLFIIIAWGISDLFSRVQYRKWILSFCSTVLFLVLGVLSWRQTGCWRNDETLYKHAIEVTPNNLWVREDFARILYRQRRFEEAAVQYGEMLRIDSNSLSAKIYLGDILVQQGKFDEAVTAYQQILPPIPQSHKGLPPGSLVSTVDPDSAVAQSGKFDELMRLFVLGHINFGIALNHQGRFEEAIEHFAEVLRIRPDSADAYFNMGPALFRLGRHKEAIEATQQSLDLAMLQGRGELTDKIKKQLAEFQQQNQPI